MTPPARYTARPAAAGVHALGEGPVWDPARERLLWVDIVAHAVHEGRLDTATGAIARTATTTFDTTVGAVAVAAGGDLLVAERQTLTRVGTGGERTPVARVLPESRASRLNDGAVDPAGRFLVGSLAQDRRRGGEILARLDAGGVTVLDRDLDLSNGLAWSPAGDLMYSVDTIPGLVRVRDYDPDTGAVGERRDWLEIGDGHPDGMCADAEGNLWIAVWGGSRVECRGPDGELLAVVDVDAPHTSSVAFAGPDLDVLVITTATRDLSPADLARHPDSGRLFTARVGVAGLPVAYWDPACAPSS
ncbi:SMP-30/gluconolactonase/LRE family protein [Dactylosporangium darangshiense]|uniref:SMP-30/Gluconolactonase/LRE-like region domain-containing protein n=1 Tax=Dactylosporangium darangshiense TaxID=579108 RepID=A0ABP8D7H0_9ACTN